MDNVSCVILGGGKGERLYPLTKERAKPAVPFGCSYRLVDIPLSNSIHAGIRNISILTQFNSDSLNNHIASTYKFDSFSKGFVKIIAAKQSYGAETGWYTGTADAIRKNISSLKNGKPDYYLILSGDQLYRMDLSKFLKEHKESNADISVASTPVTRNDAAELGILNVDSKGFINSFLEKPGYENDISEYKLPESYNGEKDYLASMGIYIFNADVLEKALETGSNDFGKEIIPDAIDNKKVKGFVYTGYWEDIGTIRSFYDANLKLASSQPQFNMYDEGHPIYAHKLYLPPSKINSCTFQNTLSGQGSIITNAFVSNSLIGIRTIIDCGASLENVYCMGADHYEIELEKCENREKKIPNIGISSGTIIRNALIDKNARIGSGCRIGIDENERPDGDFENYSIRDGIIIINKNAVLLDGTKI
jgi:glucose-1-phosphate adenylyltransferase